MRPMFISVVVSSSVALLVGCGMDNRDLPTGAAISIAAELKGRDAFAWSEPVWLGPVVNSSARDWKPSLSPHGLSLYFHSNRGGGLGGFDIWVSQRARPNCPWQAPVDLGPPVNTPLDDGDANFTPDGHVLFFSSTGRGGAGAGDIFMARRAHTNDDFAWGEPVNLGPDVNTG